MEEYDQIKTIVNGLKKKFHTSDPFKIADSIGVLYQFGNCTHAGCYMYLKKHRYIFLSNSLNDVEKQVVMAHELGHALLDTKENCYFIRHKTLLLNSKIERRANTFAAYMLIDDNILEDYKYFTKEQFCNSIGLPIELLELRLKNYIYKNF